VQLVVGGSQWRVESVRKHVYQVFTVKREWQFKFNAAYSFECCWLGQSRYGVLEESAIEFNEIVSYWRTHEQWILIWRGWSIECINCYWKLNASLNTYEIQNLRNQWVDYWGFCKRKRLLIDHVLEFVLKQDQKNIRIGITS
jgi:hypothetical protein